VALYLIIFVAVLARLALNFFGDDSLFYYLLCLLDTIFVGLVLRSE
jgi:hypothetical protein